MLALFLQMIPLGIAAAISPVAAIGGIAVASGKRPGAHSLTYNIGGLLVYGVISLIIIFWLQGRTDFGHSGDPSNLASAVKVVVGVALLVLALFAWRIATDTSPKWIETAGSLGLPSVFILGMVVLSPRLKNLALLLAAFDYIAAATAGPLSDTMAVAVFLGLTFAPTLAPLAVHVILPAERATAVTGSWRSWLERNGRVLLVAVFCLMGVKLLIEGIAELMS